MGMSIISYTISSVRTGNGYLAALGKPSIALVKRDARIGEAEANKSDAIAIAEASQQRDEKVYSTKREIVQMQQDRDMVLQANKKEVNTVTATETLVKMAIPLSEASQLL